MHDVASNILSPRSATSIFDRDIDVDIHLERVNLQLPPVNRARRSMIGFQCLTDVFNGSEIISMKIPNSSSAKYALNALLQRFDLIGSDKISAWHSIEPHFGDSFMTHIKSKFLLPSGMLLWNI